MDSFGALQQLVPELAELLEGVQPAEDHPQPRAIRRRYIAAQMDSSEQVIRGELDILQEQGLLHTSSLGCSSH